MGPKPGLRYWSHGTNIFARALSQKGNPTHLRPEKGQRYVGVLIRAWHESTQTRRRLSVTVGNSRLLSSPLQHSHTSNPLSASSAHTNPTTTSNSPTMAHRRHQQARPHDRLTKMNHLWICLGNAGNLVSKPRNCRTVS